MNIIVFQSYRSDPAPWIARCIRSVKEWCLVKGYEHRFIGDEFLELFPSSLEREGLPRIVKTDYCRLELLAQSATDDNVVVWIDADVFIWNKDLRLTIPEEKSFSVCHEMWHALNFFGIPIYNNKFNNAFMAFRGQEPLQLMLTIARHRLRYSEISWLMLGPNLITPLVEKGVLTPSIQRGVGCYGDLDTRDVKKDPIGFSKQTTKVMQHPIYAANLVHSFRNAQEDMMGVMDRFVNVSLRLGTGCIGSVDYKQPLWIRLGFRVKWTLENVARFLLKRKKVS